MWEPVVGLLIVLALVWALMRTLGQTLAAPGLSRRERAELLGLRGLVDDLKETAWDHRELDSPLATIIIDKIRSHERQQRDREA